MYIPSEEVETEKTYPSYEDGLEKAAANPGEEVDLGDGVSVSKMVPPPAQIKTDYTVSEVLESVKKAFTEPVTSFVEASDDLHATITHTDPSISESTRHDVDIGGKALGAVLALVSPFGAAMSAVGRLSAITENVIDGKPLVNTHDSLYKELILPKVPGIGGVEAPTEAPAPKTGFLDKIQRFDDGRIGIPLSPTDPPMLPEMPDESVSSGENDPAYQAAAPIGDGGSGYVNQARLGAEVSNPTPCPGAPAPPIGDGGSGYVNQPRLGADDFQWLDYGVSPDPAAALVPLENADIDVYSRPTPGVRDAAINPPEYIADPTPDYESLPGYQEQDPYPGTDRAPRYLTIDPDYEPHVSEPEYIRDPSEQQRISEFHDDDIPLGTDFQTYEPHDYDGIW